MPIIEHQTSGVPDAAAVNIARTITATPEEYRSHIHNKRESPRFIWTCLYRLMEDVGYVPQPIGNETKKIVCFVPMGTVDDPAVSEETAESLIRAFRPVHWQCEVVQVGKKLYFRLIGTLCATDVPVYDKRCILPSPVQFSHLMRPENEALTKLIWQFGDNILRAKKTFNLGATPWMWMTQDLLEKAMSVYATRGWNVRLWNAAVAGRKTHLLDFTLPPLKSLPAPGKAL
ncbi:MAG: hypothetical protein P4L53_22895 [Candidatus Obscuribacterales bacterium]|nr:hypothetical protein [Candidatus Obscuribacterales bacterium]